MSDVSGLKIGDRVIVRNGRDSYRLGTIEKMGVHHFKLVDSDSKYRRTNGALVGRDSWSFSEIEPFDQQKWNRLHAEEVENKMRYALNAFDWMRCSLDVLQAAYLAIKPPKPIENEGKEGEN